MPFSTVTNGVLLKGPKRQMDTCENAIEIIDLVKDFKVHHRTFSTLKSQATAYVGSLARGKKISGYDIRRALDHVTFSVKHGESVAIVGRNGSGKSTLLSILSRVYLPNAGVAKVRGRMVSLLELGAGFDPELTGEQNAIFNGAILGLSEQQLALRIPKILEFAELDMNTLSLPVRMYSSGMQIRLGFAIAVHLDADVLLLDEGLAVGDEGFQQKCFAKMEEFRRQGKTILMVTHRLSTIARLADRVIWLDKGIIVQDGDVKTVLRDYTAEVQRPH